jgi:hypothetical protein
LVPDTAAGKKRRASPELETRKRNKSVEDVAAGRAMAQTFAEPPWE